MPKSHNRLEIIGNIGGEPELRFSGDGHPVCNFSVACNRKYTTKEGEKKEQTDWFKVVSWGKLAEICSQFGYKGQLVFVAGRVRLNQWETQDGEKRSSLELLAITVVFLDKRKDAPSDIDTEEEDIPF